jgi:anti-sigma regulatory factor (Ser/Thr protein kinase)
MPRGAARPSAARGAARPSADLHLKLPCNDEAPAAVRNALRGLHGVGWTVGDAMLVASELVSNAVVHSGACPEDLLTVHVKLGAGRLLISVRDPGISGLVAKPRPEDDQFGGLGLRLVEQLSERWGAERRRGQRVWAELALPAQEPTATV